MTRDAALPLLEHDPQPAALLDAEGRPQDGNRALTALLEREKALKQRIKATRAEVRERATLLEETLQELRQRAELEHVRRASSALTGAEPPTRDLAIEADLEVDMIGLVQEIGRLRFDLEEDRQRARALTEVSAG